MRAPDIIRAIRDARADPGAVATSRYAIGAAATMQASYVCLLAHKRICLQALLCALRAPCTIAPIEHRLRSTHRSAVGRLSSA